MCKLSALAESIGKLQVDCGVQGIVIRDFCESALNFGLVNTVLDWAHGVSFAEICALTSVDEGTIVRCVTRLDETLREVGIVARIIGDSFLYRKATTASQLIRRDVMFATSLHLP